MAIVRYKCHTTHKVKVSDHDELNRPNTLATHFYKEFTQTVGTIITSGSAQYKCIAEHKYWQNEDPYVVSPQSYKLGTLYSVGHQFDSEGIRYKVNTAYWWFNDAVIEGGSNIKKGTKVTVGQTFEADDGTYTCIKEFWHWSDWTDFRVQKGNNEYFTFKKNELDFITEWRKTALYILKVSSYSGTTFTGEVLYHDLKDNHMGPVRLYNSHGNALYTRVISSSTGQVIRHQEIWVAYKGSGDINEYHGTKYNDPETKVIDIFNNQLTFYEDNSVIYGTNTTMYYLISRNQNDIDYIVLF